MWHILIIMLGCSWVNFPKYALVWKCHSPLPHTMKFSQNILTYATLKHQIQPLSTKCERSIMTPQGSEFEKYHYPINLCGNFSYGCAVVASVIVQIELRFLEQHFSLRNKKTSLKGETLCMCWQETARMTWGIDLWVKKDTIFWVLVGLWQTVDWI